MQFPSKRILILHLLRNKCINNYKFKTRKGPMRNQNVHCRIETYFLLKIIIIGIEKLQILRENSVIQETFRSNWIVTAFTKYMASYYYFNPTQLCTRNCSFITISIYISRILIAYCRNNQNLSNPGLSKHSST